VDFEDTPEEANFRAEAHAWLAANAKLRRDEEGFGLSIADEGAVAASKAWQSRKASAGWACIGWPTEHGGRGASPIESVIWEQEESKFDLPPNAFHIAHGQAGPTIMAHGTEAQKERWLPKMVRGEEVWCQLFSEPDAGSDLAGVRSRAIREGDEWILNGQKTWASGAENSDWGILLARTDPDVPKHAGLTYFILDMKSPGIELRPIKQITGSSDFSEVFFADVRIPDENRISGIGNGWKVAMTTLMTERAAVGAGTPGPGGERILDVRDLLQLARSSPRSDAGSALDDAAVQEKVADYYVRWTGLKYTAYRMMTALSRGEMPGGEGSIGKLVEGRLQQEMASLSLDILGASGAVADEDVAPASGEWHQAYLLAPAIRIAGGTDEILRNIIGERVLGLPPEPRADKDIAFRNVRSGTS
jgi:alkylation response protein AidB-like acyl-CoA dehydrogenase